MPVIDNRQFNQTVNTAENKWSILAAKSKPNPFNTYLMIGKVFTPGFISFNENKLANIQNYSLASISNNLLKVKDNFAF